jgi:hypothetical protein
MVIVLDDQEAVIPVGRPVAEPIPDATDVVWVMDVIGVLTHTVGEEVAAETVHGGNGQLFEAGKLT